MMQFLAVVGGAVVGQVVYVAATYRLYPPDSGSGLSLADNVWIALVFGLVSGAVFFGLHRLLKVRSPNKIALSAAAFSAQIAASAAVLVLPDFGIFGFLIALL